MSPTPQPPGSPSRRPPEPLIPRTRRLLIVEDDPATCAALAAIFRQQGFEIDVATTISGAKALMANGPTDVILDGMLPDGEGADFIRHARAAGLNPRVVVTTATCDPRIRLDLESLGPAAFLDKPMLKAVLIAAVVGED